MTEKNPLRLEPAQLTRRCSINHFKFTHTSELKSERQIYGQPRGVRAIEFGIEMPGSGYNIYVLGPAGSGRLTAIEHFLHARSAKTAPPDDWCYVQNFEDAYYPCAVRLPAGQAPQFDRDVQHLIDTLKTEIPAALETESHLQERQLISTALEDKRQAMISDLQKQATEKSLIIQTNQQGGLMIIPMQDGEAIKPEIYDGLSDDEKTKITASRRELEKSIENAFRQLRDEQKKADAELEELRRTVCQRVIEGHMEELFVKYDLSGGAIRYFHAIKDDILDNLDNFEEGHENNDKKDDAPPDPTTIGKDFFHRYKVNILVSNKPGDGAPVISVDLPTYQNLMGKIEHEIKFGMLTTDFTQIKSGALHRANGGFLILRAAELLQQPFAWEAIKRVLNSNQAVIEDPESYGMTVTRTQHLEPEPIPINMKVILVGSPQLFYLLYNLEEDFRELFRVKADFGETMERTPDNEETYARFIATRCHEEDLPHFDVEAVGRLVDYGSWLMSHQHKLTTQFGMLAPLIRESAFFARRNDHKLVQASDVDEAIAERTYRNNELEEDHLRQIREGMLYFDLDGEVVGQVNGLMVIDMGDHSFGIPGRITARVFMGRDNLVQIDRETNMTGPIHDKGVMILEGYLGGQYAHDYPLTISASVTFEQSYGHIEGDSASSAELYALLSAISGLPLRQDIAVTGSINQRGQVQPIGGATEKIEGFFKVCKQNGLTGTQGAIIPKSNVVHLMLNDEIVKTVEEGKFHIYAIDTVDEGLEILTGKDIASIHEAVDKHLREMAEKLESFGKDEDSDDDDGKSSSSDDTDEEKKPGDVIKTTRTYKSNRWFK